MSLPHLLREPGSRSPAPRQEPKRLMPRPLIQSSFRVCWRGQPMWRTVIRLQSRRPKYGSLA